MTEKKVFKYKLCGKHAFIFYHASAGPLICQAVLAGCSLAEPRACRPQSSRYSRTRISPIFHRSHRFKGREDKIFSSLTFDFEPQE